MLAQAKCIKCQTPKWTSEKNRSLRIEMDMMAIKIYSYVSDRMFYG